MLPHNNSDNEQQHVDRRRRRHHHLLLRVHVDDDEEDRFKNFPLLVPMHIFFQHRPSRRLILSSWIVAVIVGFKSH